MDNMKLYCFGLDQTPCNAQVIFDVLNKVSAGTDTRDLIVAFYSQNHLPHHHRGRACVAQWVAPGQFTTARGYWQITKQWHTPKDLPEQFKLIRMLLVADPRLYPKKETDIYGWQFKYNAFEDHLALLYAHELHHFRRYHLGLHPKEGEQKANQWALQHCQSLGFHVTGQRIFKNAFKKKKSYRHMFSDPFKSFRDVKAGEKVQIIKDPLNRYTGQDAEVIRTIRSNSKRMVIRTSDGKSWRWPMNWLKK